MYILKILWKFNFYAEIMEKFGVEVDVKIRYLYEKRGKLYF